MNIKEKAKVTLTYYYNLYTLTEKDVILASFPKSGNTWLRFILGNIYNQLEPQVDEVNFHTVNDLLPSLETPVQNRLRFNQLPRIFKTHENYKYKFYNIILVLREPADTLYSYYKYLNGARGIKISLTDTIRHPEYGIRGIITHTDSYIANSPNIQVVTYEALQEKPFATVQKICAFLNIEACDDIVRSALELSSFDSMRTLEETKGRRYAKTNFLFTRSGQVGEGQKNMSEEDLAYIREQINKSQYYKNYYGATRQ